MGIYDAIAYGETALAYYGNHTFGDGTYKWDYLNKTFSEHPISGYVGAAEILTSGITAPKDPRDPSRQKTFWEWLLEFLNPGTFLLFLGVGTVGYIALKF